MKVPGQVKEQENKNTKWTEKYNFYICHNKERETGKKKLADTLMSNTKCV